MSRSSQPGSRLLSPAALALWPEGAPRDARALLDRNPQLRGDKDAALDLAYDEYCRLIEAGETPDSDAFCARFPTFQSSLRRAIQAHEYLAANPDLLQEREAIAWPIEGETFLGFRLLRELGRGSFARVFLAAEPELGDRLVAVKVSPHGGTEAQTLGRLNHPNVVKVHAVHKDERSGLTAVCMPYLGGATLDGILTAKAAGRASSARVILEVARASTGPAVAAEEGPAPHPLLETASYAEGVCLLGAQIADALAFLHRRSVYHRDLKPSNVLLCRDGRPMLLDFNLSADPQARRERFGGTLPYMSPEQVLATFDPERAAIPVDGRSDLFSLGVILFELLTGRQPFGDIPRGVPSPEDCAALVARQAKGAPALQRLCPQVTPGLARMVAGCLAFDREQRPLDAGEVATALRRDLAFHRRALRRLRQHPRKLVAAAALTVVLAASGAVYEARQPSAGAQMITEAEAAAASGDFARALFCADRAVLLQPEAAEPRIMRAQLAVQQNRFAAARGDFHEANRLNPEGRLSAGIAYCLAREDQMGPAVFESKEALKAGFETAEVYNNLAYSQMANADSEDARRNLMLALALNPRLPAACHNYLALLTQELLGKDRKRRLAEVKPALARALDACPESAELYGDAADLCATIAYRMSYDRDAGARETEDWTNLAITHLEHAVKIGLVLGGRTEIPLYKRMKGNARYDALVKTPLVPTPDVMTVRLVDPLPEMRPVP
jgi:eukaryotic-like serine/threonine-protein kinase